MMSLLAHLVPGWRPEDAATRALAYILDPGASPGMAKAFVDLLSRGGVSPFQPGRVAHDASQADDSRPDLTLFDAEGMSRVLVEVTFWGGVPDAQPAAYLEELSEGRLPDDTRPALVYVAPRDRIPGLWNELKVRCRDSPGTDLVDESSRNGDAAWARAGNCILLIASWRYVLDSLRRAAEDPAAEQDIVQLQGLADRMEREAFLPLDASEVADVGLARRMMGYDRLVIKIADRLASDGVAHLKGNWNAGSYKAGRMSNRRMQVHGKFDLRLGIEIRAWRDSGITPLWWVLTSSDTFSTAEGWQRIKDSLDDVRPYGDSLYIPIRLKTGVEEADVIDDAVEQMRRVADRLLETFGDAAHLGGH